MSNPLPVEQQPEQLAPWEGRSVFPMEPTIPVASDPGPMAQLELFTPGTEMPNCDGTPPNPVGHMGSRGGGMGKGKAAG